MATTTFQSVCPNCSSEQWCRRGKKSSKDIGWEIGVLGYSTSEKERHDNHVETEAGPTYSGRIWERIDSINLDTKALFTLKKEQPNQHRTWVGGPKKPRKPAVRVIRRYVKWWNANNSTCIESQKSTSLTWLCKSPQSANFRRTRSVSTCAESVPSSHWRRVEKRHPRNRINVPFVKWIEPLCRYDNIALGEYTHECYIFKR